MALLKKLWLFLLLLLPGSHPQLDYPKKQAQDLITNIQSTIIPKPTAITQEGIPDFHLIKTFFVPQAPDKNWSQPWQDACEEAALLTIKYYYDKKTSATPEDIKQDLNQIFEYEKESSLPHDINLNQMSQISQELYGFKSLIIKNPSVEELKTQLSQNHPIVVPAAGKILFQENHHFQSGGPYYHNLVIVGYDDSQKQFIVHDVGTQFGSYYRYSYKLLEDAIHDFPPTLQKEDILSGQKSVLILLK